MAVAWKWRPFDSIQELRRAYRGGERPRLGFRGHAVERMRQMGVTEDEVFEAIARPQYIGYSERHQAVNLSAGRITLAVKLDRSGYPDVITILWWSREDWVAARAAGRLGAGREIRQDIRSVRHLQGQT